MWPFQAMGCRGSKETCLVYKGKKNSHVLNLNLDSFPPNLKCHIERKHKNCGSIISVDSEKPFDKNLTLILDKIPDKIGGPADLLKYSKAVHMFYEKHQLK